MFITDLNKIRLEVTDLHAAIDQALAFMHYESDTIKYNNGVSIRKYWADIHAKLTRLKLSTMPFEQFTKELPILYGQIVVNGKAKIGAFKPEWNRYSNSTHYRYYTPGGRKGTGGFTMKRAYSLYKQGRLSIDPDKGIIG